MNSIINDYYPVFEYYQALRSQLMELLEDDDLAYRPGGDNPSLGELCRTIGEVEYSYIESFKTFTQDFDYHHPSENIEGSVERLVAWYEQLDRQLKEAVQSLSEEDAQNRLIDRGGGFTVPPRIQIDIYKEALLIFYGKTSVYLRLLGKALPEQWQAWIS